MTIVHQRFDDSRPRGLASECICGRPGCTQWYADQLGVPVRPPVSHAWRSERRAPASGRLTLPRLALFTLVGLGLWGLAAVVAWSLVAGVIAVLGRVL